MGEVLGSWMRGWGGDWTVRWGGQHEATGTGYWLGEAVRLGGLCGTLGLGAGAGAASITPMRASCIAARGACVKPNKADGVT